MPLSENSAPFHRSQVVDALQRQDYNYARGAFACWIEQLKQVHGVKPGTPNAEVEDAKRAFSDFSRTDPLYVRLVEGVVQIIRNRPGILQTEMYQAFSTEKKDSVSYVLYFAAEHGRIVRTKKGRTFELSVTTTG